MIKVTNIGISGIQKNYFHKGNRVHVNVSVAGQKARVEPQRFDLTRIRNQKDVRIVVNNGQCGEDILKNAEGKVEKVELLGSPFDRSIANYFRAQFPPAAIFYSLTSGSLEEINRIINFLKTTQSLNTSLVVYGTEGQSRRVDEYKYMDFFTKVTPKGLARKIAAIHQQWSDKITSLDQFLNSALAMLRAIQRRDNYTGIHSLCVTLFANSLGRKMGLTPFQLWMVTMGALLHDLGKVGIPDHILNKPGKLDDAEFEVMKEHPIISADISSPLMRILGESLWPITNQMVMRHHNRFDGGGYPRQEEGLELSPFTFVIQMADCLDAMTTDKKNRSYRDKEYDVSDTIEDIKRNSEKQFHPDVAEAAIGVLDEGMSFETDMPISSAYLS